MISDKFHRRNKIQYHISCLKITAPLAMTLKILIPGQQIKQIILLLYRQSKKPLLPQTTESQSKIVIKSTFETHLKEDARKEPETQRVDPVLNIKPYRPLKSRSP